MVSTVCALLCVLVVQYSYVQNSTILTSTSRISIPTSLQHNSLASVRSSIQTRDESIEQQHIASKLSLPSASTTVAIEKKQDDSKAIISVSKSPEVRKTVSGLTTVLPAPSTYDDYDQTFDTLLSERIHTLTNELRIKNNLTPLQTDSTLVKNASSYSATMLKSTFLSHTDTHGCDMSCRFKKDGYVAQAWGENLATLSFDDQVTVEYVAQFFMRAWEKSDEHRANLLTSAYTREGIGIARDAHTIYVTVQFAKPL